jgi:hypothetical protein
MFTNTSNTKQDIGWKRKKKLRKMQLCFDLYVVREILNLTALGAAILFLFLDLGQHFNDADKNMEEIQELVQ